VISNFIIKKEQVSSAHFTIGMDDDLDTEWKCIVKFVML